MKTDATIKNYFKTMWKDEKVIVRQNADDPNTLLVGSPCGILALPSRHPLFDSREIFPVLPEPGKEIVYKQGQEPGHGLEPISRVILPTEQIISKTEPVTATKWLVELPGHLARVFLRGDQIIPLDKKLTDMLTLDPGEYDIRMSGKTLAVWFLDKANGAFRAVIMPLTYSEFELNPHPWNATTE